MAGMKVFITGASSGIGLEIARQYAEKGEEVTLVARREERLVHFVEECLKKQLRRPSYLVADLTKQEDLHMVANHLENNIYDLVVSNAGVGAFGQFESVSLEDQLSMIRLNVEAPVLLLHSAIRAMKVHGKKGIIVVVSSVAGLQPLPFMATYSASKAFNLFHGLSLRHELKGTGIKVITLCPGPTETEFGGVARFPGSWTNVRKNSVEEVVGELIKGIDKNRAIVVSCFGPKWYRFFSGIVPLEISTWLVHRVMKSALKGK